MGLKPFQICIQRGDTRMSERVKIILDKNADILRLPAIALRGLVVFPGNIIHFEVGRKKSIAAIEWAMSNNNAVF